MYKEIIVVEGIHDQEKVLKAYPNAFVMTTNGSALSNEFIDSLITLSKTHTITLLLDPDYPGRKIRDLLNEKIPNAKNAYIDRALSTNKEGKVGVEYASIQTIKDALNLKRDKTYTSDITLSFLIDHGYLGIDGSKEKRNKLLKELNLEPANGKKFLKLLTIYGIKKEEVLSYES